MPNCAVQLHIFYLFITFLPYFAVLVAMSRKSLESSETMEEPKYPKIMKANLVFLGIDVILLIIMANAYGKRLDSGHWRDNISIWTYFLMANLLSVPMLAVELYGTSKKNLMTMVVSLTIRCIRFLQFICFIPIVFRWTQFVQHDSFEYCFAVQSIFIIWDVFRIIIKAKIIHMIKLPTCTIVSVIGD